MKGLSQGDGATECRLCDTGLPDGPDRLDVRIPDADTRQSLPPKLDPSHSSYSVKSRLGYDFRP